MLSVEQSSRLPVGCCLLHLRRVGLCPTCCTYQSDCMLLRLAQVYTLLRCNLKRLDCCVSLSICKEDHDTQQQCIYGSMHLGHT